MSVARARCLDALPGSGACGASHRGELAPPKPPTYQTSKGLAAAAASLRCLVDALVDLGNLLDPVVPFLVFHLQDVVEGPVKMVRDIRYLAGDLLQRVAYDSPSAVAPVPMSTWNS